MQNLGFHYPNIARLLSLSPNQCKTFLWRWWCSNWCGESPSPPISRCHPPLTHSANKAHPPSHPLRNYPGKKPGCKSTDRGRVTDRMPTSTEPLQPQNHVNQEDSRPQSHQPCSTGDFPGSSGNPFHWSKGAGERPAHHHHHHQQQQQQQQHQQSVSCTPSPSTISRLNIFRIEWNPNGRRERGGRGGQRVFCSTNVRVGKNAWPSAS